MAGSNADNDLNCLNAQHKFRAVQRERHKHHRKLMKDDAVNQNRENYSEVENRFKYVTEKEMEDLALQFKKTKDNQILHKIESAACFGDKHINAFFRVDGALTTLVSVLCGKDAEKQLEAATCLTNLACGSHKSTKIIAKATGAYLISYMRSESLYLQDQCAWAVGNIASDCNYCFYTLCAQGVLPALESLLKSPHLEVLQSAAFALNMCSQYECSEFSEIVGSSLINTLLQTVKRKDVKHQTLAYILYTLSNLSNLCVGCLNDDELTKIADPVLCHFHPEVLGDDLDVMLVTPIIRVLGGLSAGSNTVCKFIMQHESFTSSIVSIMSSSFHHLKKEMLWVLTNLLISCAKDDSSINWLWVTKAVRYHLSPLDSNVLQVLNFYSTIATLKPEFVELFLNDGILQQAKTLCTCEKTDIELAAKTFLAICCK